MTKKTQRLWVFEILPRLAARHAQTFLNRLARAAHYLRNLSRVITMQKTQDKDAARLRTLSVAKPMSAAGHTSRGTLPREPRSHEQFSTFVALPSSFKTLAGSQNPR